MSLALASGVKHVFRLEISFSNVKFSETIRCHWHNYILIRVTFLGKQRVLLDLPDLFADFT